MKSDYLGTEVPLSQAMATWNRHIDCLERQYNKAFLGHHLFEANTVEIIHKRVQVLLYSCNTMSLEYLETRELAGFRILQRRVEIGEWIATATAWVKRLKG